MKGLDTAAVRLAPARKPWRQHRSRDYPAAYEEAALCLEAACPALPGDALQVIMAYCRWSDFFRHD